MLVSCVCGRERVLVKLSRCGIAIFWISHLLCICLDCFISVIFL